MKKFSKEQRELLESALDKLYTFLKEKFDIRYRGNHMIYVYGNIIELKQYSLLNHIAWYAIIDFEQRTIHIETHEVERESFHSKHWYSLHYMSSQSQSFKLNF